MINNIKFNRNHVKQHDKNKLYFSGMQKKTNEQEDKQNINFMKLENGLIRITNVIVYHSGSSINRDKVMSHSNNQRISHGIGCYFYIANKLGLEQINRELNSYKDKQKHFYKINNGVFLIDNKEGVDYVLKNVFNTEPVFYVKNCSLFYNVLFNIVRLNIYSDNDFSFLKTEIPKKIKDFGIDGVLFYQKSKENEPVECFVVYNLDVLHKINYNIDYNNEIDNEKQSNVNEMALARNYSEQKTKSINDYISLYGSNDDKSELIAFFEDDRYRINYFLKINKIAQFIKNSILYRRITILVDDLNKYIESMFCSVDIFPKHSYVSLRDIDSYLEHLERKEQTLINKSRKLQYFGNELNKQVNSFLKELVDFNIRYGANYYNIDTTEEYPYLTAKLDNRNSSVIENECIGCDSITYDINSIANRINQDGNIYYPKTFDNDVEHKLRYTDWLEDGCCVFYFVDREISRTTYESVGFNFLLRFFSNRKTDRIPNNELEALFSSYGYTTTVNNNNALIMLKQLTDNVRLSIDYHNIQGMLNINLTR